MEAGRYSEAAQALTHAIDCEPQAAELYYHRANAYRVQEKWEEAFADAIRALDRDPRNPAYFVLRGIIYREYQKDHANAERDFSQALEIDPTLASAYFERGVLYHDMRLLNDAERDLRQSLGRHGTADGVIALASVLRDKGEYEKASDALRAALEVYPAAPVRKRLQAEIERTAQAKEADH
jgi:tetratricopeptide (TPR) repeat protein